MNMQVKIGIGYDIHRFVPGRKLVLGGVDVPHSKGLSGYSDADIIIHAVCDAILGALGEGDIGLHFPDTDPKYKDISSLKLLKKVQGMLEKKHFKVGNIDVMLLLEAPKIAFFKDRMRSNISKILKIAAAQVSINATTAEGIGEIGRGKAAAAYAVALISKK